MATESCKGLVAAIAFMAAMGLVSISGAQEPSHIIGPGWEYRPAYGIAYGPYELAPGIRYWPCPCEAVIEKPEFGMRIHLAPCWHYPTPTGRAFNSHSCKEKIHD